MRAYSLLLSIALIASIPSLGVENCADGFKKASAGVPAPELSAWEKDAAELRRIRAMPNGPEKKAAIKAYSKPVPKTWKDKIWGLANWGMSAASLSIAAWQFYEKPWLLALVPPTQLLAWYAADYATQRYHKWLDSIASVRGRMQSAVQDFRKHHEYPNNLHEEDYLSNIAASAKPMAPLFALNLIATPFVPAPLSTAINTFLQGSMNTPEIHKQAHLGSKAAPVYRWLQKAGLFVTNKVHMSHHEAPFDENFAVLNGWFNPMAKRLRLWEKMDMRKWRKTKELPHTWIQDPRAIPKEVVEELKANPKLIPPELWGNGGVYNYRVPGDMKELLKTAEDNWRAEFIIRRRMIYQEASVMDQSGRTEADYVKDWEKEQEELKWIYGDKKIPLFPE